MGDVFSRMVSDIDAALVAYAAVRGKSQYEDLSDRPESEQAEICALMAASLERVAPRGSAYQAEAESTRGQAVHVRNMQYPGILRALRKDYEAGRLLSFDQLLRGEMFGDFLEMADHLLQEGYKDPAAVVAGSVLEEHLRKLCETRTPPIATTQGARPKKADTMNSELGTAGAYSKLDMKSVTAWLDLRNKAAHARYDEYSKEQVGLLIQGIRDFITRNPG